MVKFLLPFMFPLKTKEISPLSHFMSLKSTKVVSSLLNLNLESSIYNLTINFTVCNTLSYKFYRHPKVIYVIQKELKNEYDQFFKLYEKFCN